jgi:Lon protease-like protein
MLTPAELDRQAEEWHDEEEAEALARIARYRERAEGCDASASTMDDGSPEQVGTLLRGVLAAQLATLELLYRVHDHTERLSGP